MLPAHVYVLPLSRFSFWRMEGTPHGLVTLINFLTRDGRNEGQRTRWNQRYNHVLGQEGQPQNLLPESGALGAQMGPVLTAVGNPKVWPHPARQNFQWPRQLEGLWPSYSLGRGGRTSAGMDGADSARQPCSRHETTWLASRRGADGGPHKRPEDMQSALRRGNQTCLRMAQSSKSGQQGHVRREVIQT